MLKIPPSSAIGKALNYLLSEWPFAVGRKNWLFSDSVEGAWDYEALTNRLFTISV